MFQKIKRPRTLLAVCAHGHGFSYSVHENIDALVSWGLCSARRPINQACIKKFKALLRETDPVDVVFEDIPKIHRKKRRRVHQLTTTMTRIAKRHGCTVHSYSRAQIREAFSPHMDANKYVIAAAIGEIYPKLKASVPQKPKMWEAEPLAMGYFTALSLSLTHYYFMDMV